MTLTHTVQAYAAAPYRQALSACLFPASSSLTRHLWTALEGQRKRLGTWRSLRIAYPQAIGRKRRGSFSDFCRHAFNAGVFLASVNRSQVIRHNLDCFLCGCGFTGSPELAVCVNVKLLHVRFSRCGVYRRFHDFNIYKKTGLSTGKIDENTGQHTI